jgi:hypothetical protein
MISDENNVETEVYDEESRIEKYGLPDRII